MRRPGRVRRVDSERHARHSSIPELGECAYEQRFCIAAATVVAAHTEYPVVAASDALTCLGGNPGEHGDTRLVLAQHRVVREVVEARPLPDVSYDDPRRPAV